MDKREHHNRASEHLDSGEDARLAYAALELRLCLEEIAYAKLKTYTKRLPDEIKKTWQPPQAIKALLSIEPGADRDFTLRVSREETPGEPAGPMLELGTHRTLRAKRLNKLYNKLGSYLHAESPFVPNKKPHPAVLQEMRKALEEMVGELEPVVASYLDSSIAMQLTFQCSICKTPLLCNEQGLEQTGRAVCLSPDCNAEYEGVRDEQGEWVLKVPQTKITCQKCRHENWVRNQLLQVGAIVVCRECEARHELALAVVLEQPEDEEADAERAPGSKAR